MLQSLNHAALWATRSYDVSHAWFAIMLFAAAIPPLARYLYLHRWQFNLRHLLLGTTAVAVVLTCLHDDFASFRMYRADAGGELIYPAGLWHAILVLISSSLFTWALTPPDADKSKNEDN